MAQLVKKCFRASVLVFLIGIATQKILCAQISSTLGNSISSVTAIPLNGNAHLFSDFHFSASAGVGYYPGFDTSVLNSGLTRSYWVQSSQTIFGLPFSFNYSSANQIAVDQSAFSFQQFQFSFDYTQYLENIKSRILDKYMEPLNAEREKLMSMHMPDSSMVLEHLMDTLGISSYQDYIHLLNDTIIQLNQQQILSTEDSIRLAQIQSRADHYSQYQERFRTLLDYEQKFYELQETIFRDSSIIQQNISQVQQIGNKDELRSKTSELGINLAGNSFPLNIRQAAIGNQVLNSSPLTFQNYFGKGVSFTYDDKYILKTAAVNDQWTTGLPSSISDSLINPFENGNNILIVGAGKGDLDTNYAMITVALIADKVPLLSPPRQVGLNRWLVSFSQQTYLSRNASIKYEVAHSIAQQNTSQVETNSPNDFVGASAGIVSTTYNFVKAKGSIELESSLIGPYYLTLGNALNQPGSVNAAFGCAKELLHSNLSLNYKINVSHFISSSTEQRKSWYQLAQVMYRLRKYGAISLVISPYQFNYLLPTEQYTSQSNAGFVSVSGYFTIPINKNNLTLNATLSNYAYQNTLSDTTFSSETKQINLNVSTNLFNRQILGSSQWYIPGHTAPAMNFFNTAELKIDVFHSSSVGLMIGPSWRGFTEWSDLAGATIDLQIKAGKHWGGSVSAEQYLNIQPQLPAYPQSTFFTAGLFLQM